MSNKINEDRCRNDFHGKMRNYFEGRGIRYYSNYPRCTPSFKNGKDVIIFYTDNIIKILKFEKGIDLMDDYKKNPTKYHNFLFERFEPILFNSMDKYNVDEFTIYFKNYDSPEENIYELVLRKGINFGKLRAEYNKK